MNKRHTLTLALAITLSTGNLAPSNADVYVKVDANGKAIDGPIMCDSGTCGAGSLFSKLTLKEGESYVLQGSGSAGIGGNNPNVEVKVDIPTQTWTITTLTNVQTFTPATNPYVPQTPVATPIQVVETKTVMSDTATAIVDTKTVTVDTKTVITKIDTKTVTAKIVKKKRAKKK